MKMHEQKLTIARWIAGCNEVTEEIEFLLDKAYPDGAEDRFYSEWHTVLEACAVDGTLGDEEWT